MNQNDPRYNPESEYYIDSGEQSGELSAEQAKVASLWEKSMSEAGAENPVDNAKAAWENTDFSTVAFAGEQAPLPEDAMFTEFPTQQLTPDMSPQQPPILDAMQANPLLQQEIEHKPSESIAGPLDQPPMLSNRQPESPTSAEVNDNRIISVISKSISLQLDPIQTIDRLNKQGFTDEQIETELNQLSDLKSQSDRMSGAHDNPVDEHQQEDRQAIATYAHAMIATLNARKTLRAAEENSQQAQANDSNDSFLIENSATKNPNNLHENVAATSAAAAEATRSANILMNTISHTGIEAQGDPLETRNIVESAYNSTEAAERAIQDAEAAVSAAENGDSSKLQQAAENLGIDATEKQNDGESQGQNDTNEDSPKNPSTNDTEQPQAPNELQQPHAEATSSNINPLDPTTQYRYARGELTPEQRAAYENAVRAQSIESNQIK